MEMVRTSGLPRPKRQSRCDEVGPGFAVGTLLIHQISAFAGSQLSVTAKRKRMEILMLFWKENILEHNNHNIPYHESLYIV